MEQVDRFSTVAAVVELGRLHRTSERLPVTIGGGLDAPALRGPAGCHSRPAAGMVAPCSWQTEQAPSRCPFEPLLPHPGCDPADDIHECHQVMPALPAVCGCRRPERRLLGDYCVLLPTFTRQQPGYMFRVCCFQEPTIDCHSSKYKRYLVLVGFAMVLVVVGLPLAIAVMLWLKRAAIQHSADAAAMAAPVSVETGSVVKTAADTFVGRFGILWQAYRPKSWFFEVIVLARRTLLVFLVTFVPVTGGWRYPALVLTLCGLLLSHLALQPFAVALDNRAEAVSLLILMLIAVVLSPERGGPVPLGSQVVVLMLLFGAFGAGLVLMVHQKLQLRRHQQMQQAKAPGSDQSALELASPAPAHVSSPPAVTL